VNLLPGDTAHTLAIDLKVMITQTEAIGGAGMGAKNMPAVNAGNDEWRNQIEQRVARERFLMSVAIVLGTLTGMFLHVVR
jgi:hypothetical protein